MASVEAVLVATMKPWLSRMTVTERVLSVMDLGVKKIFDWGVTAVVLTKNLVLRAGRVAVPMEGSMSSFCSAAEGVAKESGPDPIASLQDDSSDELVAMWSLPRTAD